MRPAFLRLLPLTLALLTPIVASARDPWFPDGPVQPQIAHGVMLPPKSRTPQFPLKTARTLHTDAEIAQLRANVAEYPSAKAAMEPSMVEARYWAAWTDEALHDLVTTAEVPRAVELNPDGCPIHGRKIYEGINGSSFPWIVDPKHPFQVKCPIGGETYPSNDYAAFYHSGFKDKSSLTGKYVDDGWGWVAPDGKRYWFVAHANHLVWQGPGLDSRCIINGIRSLGRAYLLTGDKLYAHKAAVLFRRVAEVYPSMNYEQQSRFGQLMAETGTRYTGKIVNLIWESYQIAPSLSEAYDDIWETIDGDTALQKFYGQTGEQIRACIEANYFEEAIDGYFNNMMRGNYGTHQRALLMLALVRQHGDTARYVNEVLHRPDGHLLRIGFDYAFYDSVYRDGAPHESPDYNFVWVHIFAETAQLLKSLGYDITQLPRLKRMFDEPLDYVTIGSLSDPLGDATNRYAPLIRRDSLTYQIGLKLYGDPRYATFLAGIGATGDKTFGSYEALFSPALIIGARTDSPPTANHAGAAHSEPAERVGGQPAAARVLPPQPSRIFSGYGSAILNNPADTRSVDLFYGLHVSHYHHDRLHFDLFAHGQDMMPDLGYPDGANEFNSGIYTWSKSTISHNTVTVDAHRQNPNPAGHLQLFADGPFARALVADADGTYPQTTTYRRTLVMVDVPDTATAKDRGYVVDFFDVTGGHQHDYSLHGPTGKYTAIGGTWSAPAPGTLAGPNVKVGELYDDPVRGAKGFKGSYLDYQGSGFQHLFNVQRLQSGAGDFIAEYVHDRDPNARLRIRVMPQPGQELIHAEARVSPIKYPEIVNYLIARRVAGVGDPELKSTFAAVLEPFASEPFIANVNRAELGKALALGVAQAGSKSVGPSHFAGGTVITVTRIEGEHDIVIHRTGPDIVNFTPTTESAISTDADVAVVTFDAKDKLLRAFFAGGSFLQIGATRLTAAGFEGRITAIDVNSGKLHVRLSTALPFPDLATLTGRVLHLSNPLRQTVQTITAATREGDELVLTLKDDLRVGLVRVDSVEGATVNSKTALRIFAIYRGTTLCNRADQPLATVLEAKDSGQLTLTAPPTGKITPGEDVWMVDGAVGETVTLPAILSWTR
ncbi:MAG: heparinase II/III family protein [Opitutaceae bacterium]